MKRPPLWKVSLTTTAEAEDAVSELLANTFGQPVSSYRDLETGRTWVTAYLEKKPGPATHWRQTLQGGLKHVKECGLKVGPARILLARVRWDNWAESWKRHFKPLAVGSALLIKPSWSRRGPRKGQAVVVLDPGLSFGTGRHPTTAFCLRQLVKHRRPGERQSFLDIGTGSGILAIAAEKLGYSPVHAFDNDPEAIRVARANARQNDAAARISFVRRDLASLPLGAKRYSIVCANLTSNLLRAERERILAQVQPGGRLVLAGILAAEFLEIQAAYEGPGLRLLASRAQREWRSGAFG
jgi:ribosomal protein L11 methyltransferase